MLKLLSIDGFKSFARKTEFIFDANLIAVVGPNGSGKSNVAEAFRFALGEQSKKSMRIFSADDLIWAGNNYLTRKNVANVELLFDNKKKIFDIDTEELSISRLIARDGLSDFLLNGSKVRLKDAQKIISTAGLGPSSYFMLAQGEVDRILNISDKERADIIKDATGLGKFYIQKNEAERKLKKTQENIESLLVNMNSLKLRLAKLEALYKAHQKRNALEEELLSSYLSFILSFDERYSRESWQLNHSLQNISSKIGVLQEKIDNSLNMLENSTSKQDEKRRKLELKLLSISEEQVKLQNKKTKLKLDLSSLRFSFERSKSAYVRFDKEFIEELVKILDDIIYDRSFDKDALLKIRQILNDNLKDHQENTSLENEILRIKKKIKELEIKEQDLLFEKKQIKEELALLPENDEPKEKKIIKEDIDNLLAQKEALLRQKQSLSYQIDSLENDKRRRDKLFEEARDKFKEKFLFMFTNSNKNALKPKTIMDIERIKMSLSSLLEVSEADIKEYEELKVKFDFLQSELDDLDKSKKDTEKLIKELNEKIATDFQKASKSIANYFEDYMSIVFPNSRAKLVLYDEDSKEGKDYKLDLQISLANKNIKSLSALSGGEKTLVSLAFLFALLSYNAPPFVVLDEADAALDELNSERYANILQELSLKSQIISITHNRQTMGRAEKIFGITMGQDAVSQVFELNIKEAQDIAAR